MVRGPFTRPGLERYQGSPDTHRDVPFVQVEAWAGFPTLTSVSENMIHLFAGIDVSKDTLDISATLDGISFHSLHTTNSDKGYAALLKWLAKFAAMESWRITLEATSAYHRGLVLWFEKKGSRILVMNPKQARDLAKGLGILRKNDRTDARVLALCSQMAWKEPTPLPSGKRMELQEISRRIDVLTKQRAGELRRLQKPGACKALLASCRHMAGLLAKEIARLEQQWSKTLEHCTDLATIFEVVKTVPGVGAKTARVVVSELYVTERERTVKECAAYAGVVPHEQTSGTSLRRKPQIFTTGNKRLRSALYMGAISIVSHDAESRHLYERIVDQGKPRKIGVVAVMNKTMRRIAAVAKRGTPWVPA